MARCVYLVDVKIFTFEVDVFEMTKAKMKNMGRVWNKKGEFNTLSSWTWRADVACEPAEAESLFVGDKT